MATNSKYEFGVEIQNKKVIISRTGTRIIDNLDFTTTPILPYLEIRFGLKNIYLENSDRPINSVEYKKIKNYEQSN